MISLLVRALVLALLLALIGFPATIVSQPPNQTHIYQISSFEHADDIVLTSPATIAAIRIWAVASLPNSEGTAEPPGGFQAAFSGTISWAFRTNTGNLPGNILFSGFTSSITPVATGTVLFGALHEYSLPFNLSAPVTLVAGRYWLELHEGSTLTTNDGSEIDWETAVPNGTSPLAEAQIGGPINGQFYLGSEQLAFELVNTPFAPNVPEPATAVILSVGLIVLGVGKRFIIGKRFIS
jgi:hypothetical protein